MSKFDHAYPYLISLILIVIPLYPKFPLFNFSGTFVALRLEDLIIAAVVGFWLTRRPSLVTPLHKSILLYLFIAFVSAFSGIFLAKSADLKLGLLHALRRVEYMSLFFIGFSFLKSLSQLSFLVRTFLLVSCLVALYGLGQQYLGFPVISTSNSEFSKGLALSLGPEARINSTFAGHYDLAAFSLFPLLLVLGLLTIDTRPKLLLLVSGLLIYWALLLSASRVTFAAFFISASLFLWYLRRRLWLLPLGLLAFISVLVSPQLLGRYRSFVINHLFSYASPAYAQAVDEKTADALKPPAQPEDRSLNIRLKAEWPRALRAFTKNPILGTGFSSVGLAVDNDYLRALAETGLLGLLSFMFIFIRYFKFQTRLPAGQVSNFKLLPSDLSKIFIASVSFSLVGLLLNAVFIDVFAASKIATLTWLLLGLSAKTKYLLLESKQ